MKKYFLTAALLVWIVMSWSACYQVGEANSATSMAPLNGNFNYNWSRMILTRSEINAAGLAEAGDIAGLGFCLQNLVGYNVYPGQRIYVRNTVINSYTSTMHVLPDSSSFVRVFSGNAFLHGQGWVWLTFDTPFYWDNSQNLEILWINMDGTQHTQVPNFTATDLGSNRLAHSFSDAALPTGDGSLGTIRPDIQLITPMLPDPAIVVYPLDGSWSCGDAGLYWKSGGGCPEAYDLYLDTQDPPMQLAATGLREPRFTPALSPNTRYYWKVLPVNASGQAENCPVWSFRTPAAGCLTEGFELGVPTGWVNPGAFISSPNYAFHGYKCLYKGVGTTGNLLGTLVLSVEAGDRLVFHARCTSASGNARYRLKYSPDGSNWLVSDILGVLATTPDWHFYELDLTPLAGSDCLLGLEFYTSSGTSGVYLDDVIVTHTSQAYPIPVSCLSCEGGNMLLAWEQVPGATGYNVYISNAPNIWEQAQVVHVDAGTISYSDYTGERRFYRVTAEF
jgi:hypothetical protein